MDRAWSRLAGLVFDAMDATIYALVLHPALHDLLSGNSVSRLAGIDWLVWWESFFSIFLIGWAIGGIAFGILATASAGHAR